MVSSKFRWINLDPVQLAVRCTQIFIHTLKLFYRWEIFLEIDSNMRLIGLGQAIFPSVYSKIENKILNK